MVCSCPKYECLRGGSNCPNRWGLGLTHDHRVARSSISEVLLVVDHEVSREMLTRRLQRRGYPCLSSCRCNPAPHAPSCRPERSASCSLPVENMLANRIGIAASRCKDVPPIGQLHRRHHVWGLQQIVQHRGCGRSPDAGSRSATVARLASFLPAKPNWT